MGVYRVRRRKNDDADTAAVQHLGNQRADIDRFRGRHLSA
jgi:hypothetical protein